MTISPQRPVPQSARDTIKTAIENGVYGPGERLPGERALAASLSISRASLREGLQELAKEGIVTSSPQRGWFVAVNRVSEPPNELRSFTQLAHELGLEPSTRVLHSQQRPAQFEEAKRLAIAPASAVLELHRHRSLDGTPYSLDRTIVSLGRAPGLEKVDFNNVSLYQMVEEVSGIQIAKSSYSVRADAADAYTAELLELEVGMPVLVGDEITYDLRELPILSSELTYRGDAYRFEATLYHPRLLSGANRHTSSIP